MMKMKRAAVLAMLLAMICVGARASADHVHTRCYCGERGCNRTDTGHSHNKVFTPFGSEENNVLSSGNILPAGNYYLTESIRLTQKIHIQGEVYLCQYFRNIELENGDNPFIIDEGGALYLHHCEPLDGLSPHKCEICSCGTVGCGETGNGHGVLPNPFVTLGDEYLMDGFYYLPGDRVIDKPMTVNGTVVLCLNGHTLSLDAVGDIFTIPEGSHLYLYDCNGSKFNRGKITHTPGKTGSGVHIAGGSLTLYSGAISGNKATGDGGGVRMTGATSTMTMHGGAISDNEAAGDGGGVSKTGLGGSLALYSGAISGNKAAGDGGGVSMTGEGSNLLMEGGTISDNTAAGDGGGVSVTGNGGLLTLYSGAIRDNEAAGDGGGVSVTGNGGSLTLYGGAIRDNEAAGDGGGVSMTGEGGSLLMAGGTISDNTAENGGGVSAGQTIVRGNATIFGNRNRYGYDNNLYLKKNQTISVDWGSTDTGKMGVTTQEEPTPGTPVILANSLNDGVLNKIVSDNPAYEVKENEDGGAALFARYTAPVAKTGLVYDGSEKELVTAGKLETGVYGELQYSLGNEFGPGETWSDKIPKSKNAGTHYVWYRVVIDNGYNRAVPKCVPVGIGRAMPTVEHVRRSGEETLREGMEKAMIALSCESSVPGRARLLPGKLKAGENECDWVFIPENDNYELVYGKMTLTVEATPQSLPELPRTGDASSLLGWATLLGASCAGLRARRKK